MNHPLRVGGEKLAVPMLGLITAITMGSACGKPFEADSKTLLLADFDQNPYRANYANGWDEFAGSGAPLVEGYYGKAVDLSRAHSASGEEKVPEVAQWAFWPKGNVRYEEGTLEFWFRAAMDEKAPPIFKSDALYFFSFQPLRPETEAPKKEGAPKKVTYFQPTLKLDNKRLSYLFVTLGGKTVKGSITFEKVPGFNRPLAPSDWHHFSMTWCDGELAIYIDGKKAASHDIRGEHGLSLAAQAHRPIGSSGLVLDEFRISSVVRYPHEFEPNWRDGERPSYAFSGVPGLGSPAVAYRDPVAPETEKVTDAATPQSWKNGKLEFQFDRATGQLLGLASPTGKSPMVREGLQLYRGDGREPLRLKLTAPITSAQDTGGLTLAQEDGHGLKVTQRLNAASGVGTRWSVEIKNESSQEQKLEVLLGIPLPMQATVDYFDGSWLQKQLQFPRRRDEFVFTLPFAAASDGKDSIGVGINPHAVLSNLVSEWIPEGKGGVIRQGTRVVLKPGESRELDFRVVEKAGGNGALDAVDGYHSIFPEFYRLNPAVPVYSYMGVAQHFDYVNLPDLGRMFYTGNQWGHGPYHTKGDYMGTEKYWKNPALEGQPGYAHAQGAQRRYSTIENLREIMLQKSKHAFEYCYTLRRSHDVPNLTAAFIVKDLWPEFEPKDDPLVAGQYYLPNNYIVNECNTVFGTAFIDHQTRLMELIGKYSPGLINDMCHSSPYRFVDAIARETPGRGFSPDRGVYLVAGAGHVERYKKINAFEKSGYKQSIWSDGGNPSYMLSAHSAANAQEAGERFQGLSSLSAGFQAGRYLLGEKPLVLLVSYGHDALGKFFEPDDFTPATLREYYRSNLSNAMLLALKRGMYLDPPYLHGHRWMVEQNPILVESLINGRKLVPGGKVDDPLWLVRGGSGWDSLWAFGNQNAEPAKTDLSLDAESFDGAAPVIVDYFGGQTVQKISAKGTHLSALPVDGQSLRAFKAVARLRSEGEAVVKADLRGDGLSMRLELDLECESPVQMEVNPFPMLYEIAEVRVDDLATPKDEIVTIPKGKHRLSVVYRSKALHFSSEVWKNVDLLKDGKVNFCLVGNPNPGFENGTAMQLNLFLQQYDEENGVVGDLPPARIYHSEAAIPADYSGWKVVLSNLSGAADPAERGIFIDEARRVIRVAGAHPGDVRRQMMLLMRLVDRKYPHIGRSYPLRKDISAGWEADVRRADGEAAIPPQPKASWMKLMKDKETAAFFQNFSDPDFLKKPILDREEEPVYADGTLDFAGKYGLRWSPWLLEPTYACDYVYGYRSESSDQKPVVDPQ